MRNELQTLKDVADDWNNFIRWGEEREVDVKSVREELGIKWIKAFQKGECHTDFAADDRKGQENIIEWIQHVLNISDEDLK